MANTIEPGSSLAELITTLDLSQVPVKLHCQSCKGFLLNAYKTSCCEQGICEPCYENLPDHCPSCTHKPFSKDLCRIVKGPRGTAKAYLKSIEKSRAELRDAEKVSTTPVVEEQVSEDIEVTVDVTDAAEVVEADHPIHQQIQAEPAVEESSMLDVQPSIEEGLPMQDNPIKNGVSEQDEEQTLRQASESTDGNDDEVEIQVEPSQEDEYQGQTHHPYMDDDDQGFAKYDAGDVPEKQEDAKDTPNRMDTNNYNSSNMTMGFNNNMDMNPMAMMQQMMMNGINPMMGMPMGMNAGMFGGLTGQNGGMNGMNMGMMNFNPNQNMFGWNNQSNNSWQNNNANAFSNGMSADFGSQFGFDMSQQGNFQQQQFRNGDFQNGYTGYRGRGRGRGRGGYGRGRGSFNQYSQNSYQGYQNAHEQQQNEIQQMQSQMVNGQESTSRGSRDNTSERQEPRTHNEDLAPGGQDEVNEALGDENKDSQNENNVNIVEQKEKDVEDIKQIQPQESPSELSVTKAQSPAVQEEVRPVEKPIPEAYHEDFESMAPPSAPLGPSARYGDRDFGFRSRGPGRFASRGRGSFSMQNGHTASPVRSVSQTTIAALSPPAKGTGVQGAPTGPRAMREPSAPKAAPRANGGFQIMGRAALQSQTPQPPKHDRTRSQSPVATDYDKYDDDRSRRQSRHDRYDDSKYENGSENGYDRSEKDRKRRKSRRDDYDDYDMQDADQSHSRSESHDRKTSHRSSRYDKEKEREKDKYSSKHKSSRRYHDEDTNGDYDEDDYGERAESRSSKHRSSHKSSGKTSSKYDERPKEKEDRHRKRSRHDRDRDEEYGDEDEAEEESRHRSRRRKKEHHSSSRRDRERDDDRDVEDDIGLRISGRSGGRNTSTSALATPTSTAATTPLIDKDPHTLEREARNRERMEKETQRRQKAAQGKTGSQKPSRATVSGGRRVSYKYEDEVERGMDERDSARWR